MWTGAFFSGSIGSLKGSSLVDNFLLCLPVHHCSGCIRAVTGAILLYGQSVSCFRLNTSKSTIKKKIRENSKLLQSLHWSTLGHLKKKTLNQHQWETSDLWEGRRGRKLQKALQLALLPGKRFVQLHIKLGSRASLCGSCGRKRDLSFPKSLRCLKLPLVSHRSSGHMWAVLNTPRTIASLLLFALSYMSAQGRMTQSLKPLTSHFQVRKAAVNNDFLFACIVATGFL